MIFLSTLPARGATAAFLTRFCLTPFLSTLPARGATLIFIHFLMDFLNFYPRSPRGERRAGRAALPALPAISIHAPREGSDGGRRTRRRPHDHFYPRSPRGERRPEPPGGHERPGHFYPRSPRGERPNVADWAGISYDFYPRSPRGERRRMQTTALWMCPIFLSTLPARGATSARPSTT